MVNIASVKTKAHELAQEATRVKKDIQANWKAMSATKKVTVAINAALPPFLAAMAFASWKGHLGSRKAVALGALGTGAAAFALRATALEMSRGANAKTKKMAKKGKPTSFKERMKSIQQRIAGFGHQATIVARKHPKITLGIVTTGVAALSGYAISRYATKLPANNTAGKKAAGSAVVQSPENKTPPGKQNIGTGDAQPQQGSGKQVTGTPASASTSPSNQNVEKSPLGPKAAEPQSFWRRFSSATAIDKETLAAVNSSYRMVFLG